jgi:hypothetical protein
MKHIGNKCKLPEPWYYDQTTREERMDALSIYTTKPKTRTYAECEAVLVAAGFTADQVQALKACGAIQV